ncbi:MAG: selenium-dependent molybdenum cofactor biosynthesis protein YqeB [Trichloromonadaceae bacterium]
MQTPLKDRLILIKGAGEMATGVACRLYRANFRRILMLEIPAPLAVRRRVSFSEAIPEGQMQVEGIVAVRVETDQDLLAAWAEGSVAVRVDPQGESVRRCRPDVLIDATLAKRNLGLKSADAPLVIALGPGFVAGQDCHIVIETNRGHDLGRLITCGAAAADTGVPGEISGFSKERVLRAPIAGLFSSARQIGDPVRRGEVIGSVAAAPVTATIDGFLRGLIRPETIVSAGLKIGDIDPRGEAGCCETISDKARALGGAVLEALLSSYNR